MKNFDYDRAKKIVKFWLIAFLLLTAAMLVGWFYVPAFTNPYAGYNPSYEFYLNLRYNETLTILCTALILYHLKFHK